MKKLLIAAAFGASASFTAGPAFADKVTAWDGRDKITVGGKMYEISGKRTAVKIGGANSSRAALKVGMDCKVTGIPGGEASAITCK